MRKDYDIQILIEMEDCIKNGLEFTPLNNTEDYYYDLALRIPYEDLFIKLMYYREHFLIIDEIQYFKDMVKYYNCNDIELRDRIKVVYRINRHRNKSLKVFKKTK